MVDYAIALDCDNETRKEITETLKDEPPDAASINYIIYGYLRHRPIAISIEIKTPDSSTEEAHVQLLLWATAHFNRLRGLRSRGASKDARLIDLPMLHVHGADWFALFAVDQGADGVVSVLYIFLFFEAVPLINLLIPAHTDSVWQDTNW